jgi:lysozyme
VENSMTDATKMLIKHEGFRLYPYVDTVGKVTIGIGRNLTDMGISEEEAYYFLWNDLNQAEREISNNLGHVFYTLPKAKQGVLINMCFNLGIKRFMGFKKMIAALKEKDYKKAAEEMIDSKWATQVGNRAIELRDIMIEKD